MIKELFKATVNYFLELPFYGLESLFYDVLNIEWSEKCKWLKRYVAKMYQNNYKLFRDCKSSCLKDVKQSE